MTTKKHFSKFTKFTVGISTCTITLGIWAFAVIKIINFMDRGIDGLKHEKLFLFFFLKFCKYHLGGTLILMVVGISLYAVIIIIDDRYDFFNRNKPAI